MTLTDDEFIKLVKTNKENEDIESDGFKEIAKALENEANVNSNSGEYGTPLHIAAKSGNIPLMTLLLEKGADINYNNTPGIFNRKWTPLYYVIDAIIMTERNRLAPITATGIWTAKTPEGREEQRNEAREKILELRNKRDKAVKFLLSKGADVKKENFEWKQPVEDTVYNKYYNLTELLLKHGADPRSVLDYSSYIENNHTTMDDRMLKLLMEYAIRDPNYEPKENAHHRVELMYNHYRQQKEEKDKIIDKKAEESNVPQEVSNQIKSFIDGSGKRKSRKSKAKKSNKAKKLKKSKKNRKNRSTKKNIKSRK
jgi:ankyrin repeat protein